MKKLIVIVLLLILMGSGLWAQDLPRLVVLDSEVSGGIEKGLGNALREKITTVLVQSGQYTVIPAATRDQILQEAEFIVSDCSDNACGLQVGRLLTSQFVILGKLLNDGRQIQTTISILNVETGAVEKQGQISLRGGDSFSINDNEIAQLIGRVCDIKQITSPALSPVEIDLSEIQAGDARDVAREAKNALNRAAEKEDINEAINALKVVSIGLLESTNDYPSLAKLKQSFALAAIARIKQAAAVLQKEGKQEEAWLVLRKGNHWLDWLGQEHSDKFAENLEKIKDGVRLYLTSDFYLLKKYINSALFNPDFKEKSIEQIKTIHEKLSRSVFALEFKKDYENYFTQITKRWPGELGDNYLFPRMQFVPEGSFQKEGRNIEVSAFYIDRFELTQGIWKDVMGENNNPSRFEGDDRPVENVNWYMAVKFCNLLSLKEELTPVYSINGSTSPDDWGAVSTSQNKTWDSVSCNFEANGYRLPTEAEWEYAARGGPLSQGFTYAGSNDVDEVAEYEGNNDKETKAVGGKKPNELGLFDMSGNVDEWCWDWYTEGLYRTIRGGSWYSIACYCEVASRNYWRPYPQDDGLGFRLARSFQ